MVDKNVMIGTLITSNEKGPESYRSRLFEYLRERNGRNLEPFSLVWYDADVNNIEEKQRIQHELRRSISFLKLFSDPDECQTYINENKTEKVSCAYEKTTILKMCILDYCHYVEYIRYSTSSSCA